MKERVRRAPKRVFNVRDTEFYRDYVASDEYMTVAARAREFMNRFRLPLSQVRNLVVTAREEDWFTRYGFECEDATGTPGAPLEVLVLGALRYMGRHCVLDDLEERTKVSKSTFQRFIPVFWHEVRTRWTAKYIVFPTTAADFARHGHDFATLGLPGCVMAVDCTHVKSFVTHMMRNMHVGKEGFPTRSFILGCDYSRRILFTDPGKPGTWSDVMQLLYQRQLCGVHSDGLGADYEWHVRDAQGMEQTRHGPWFLVDNGFVDWACLMCPFKLCSDMNKIIWSQWVESVRKVVERVFGILKRRWQILASGFRMHSVQELDDCWFACCIFHNLLLDLIERDAFANIADDDEDLSQSARERLAAREEDRSLRMGIDSVEMPTDVAFEQRRQELVNHFMQLYNSDEVQWVRRATPTGPVSAPDFL
jgi:hypothetical protein